MVPVLSLLALLTPFAPGRPAAAPLPGEAVVRSAVAMYAGKWYKAAQWVQRTSQQGAMREETWYTSLQPPGFLRYDVAPATTGRALIYRNDSLYQFGKGQLRGRAPDVQPLFVLLHDLHSAKPEKTIAMLKKYRFDLSRTHERTWDGARVIVVGALAGDSTSNQFWLDKKKMVLVRLIERNGSDPRRPLDARISGYEKAAGGWLERTVAIFLGRDLTTLQEYTDVTIDPKIEPGLFEPLPYHLPQWVNGAKDIFGNVPNMNLPGH
jgi:hypothetical protein